MVFAPLAGVVLSENVEPGMYVAAGTPVVTVGDLVNVWLRAYINETDLGRVKVGQPVRVTTDTYPGEHYEGRVSFIASQAEFTPKNVQTEKERVELVYRVKVDIENPHMELKPGMPADGEILLGGTAENAEASPGAFRNAVREPRHPRPRNASGWRDWALFQIVRAGSDEAVRPLNTPSWHSSADPVTLFAMETSHGRH